MTILAFDLGTHCGWAESRGNLVPSTWGHWDLLTKKGEGGGMRYLRFRTHLRDLLDASKPEMVVYERIHRHAGTQAAHVYGGLQAELMAELDLRGGIPYEGVTPGEWKKACGIKGNAGSKVYHLEIQAMVSLPVVTEDEAAAIGILLWALHHRAGGLCGAA